MKYESYYPGKNSGYLRMPTEHREPPVFFDISPVATKVKIKRVHPDAVIPKYATPGSAGFDMVAVEDVTLEPGEAKLVRTGLAFEIPEGYEMQVRPRSGISLKTPLRIANSPGTVDADFRGEVRIIAWNTGDDEISINKGDRIAQGVIAPVVRAQFEVVDELSETERGAGAFGSTGTKTE
jgi:dUTP pyrophosphatase